MVAFSVPFISSAVSAQARECVRRAYLGDIVSVVQVRPSNLKPQLVSNRLYDCACTTSVCVVWPSGREGDCRVSGVVYFITSLKPTAPDVIPVLKAPWKADVLSLHIHYICGISVSMFRIRFPATLRPFVLCFVLRFRWLSVVGCSALPSHFFKLYR